MEPVARRTVGPVGQKTATTLLVKKYVVPQRLGAAAHAARGMRYFQAKYFSV